MTKTVCVFCSSSTLAPDVMQAAYMMADDMAREGWDLVYGGSKLGVMGLVAKTFMEAGRQVTGIIPQALREQIEPEMRGVDEIYVESMAERKFEFRKRADAFVTLEGGPGTHDEFYEELTGKLMHSYGATTLPEAHTKPLVLVRHEKFAVNEALYQLVKASDQAGTLRPGKIGLVHIAPWSECFAYLRHELRE